MPIMKRDKWLRLTPRERLAHRLQRQIDRIEALKAAYDRGRASGKNRETDPLLGGLIATAGQPTREHDDLPIALR